jgi:hypothetical protein
MRHNKRRHKGGYQALDSIFIHGTEHCREGEERKLLACGGIKTSGIDE